MNTIGGSFRDPSGFVFEHEGVLYRRVNYAYKVNYIHLVASGLYQRLVDSRMLLPHEEVLLRGPQFESAYKILKPEPVPFVSYPYEWSFSQLKDAAVTTLKLQLMALNYGMSLKDASAFNIQFIDSDCLLMDTLSFEIYSEGRPWTAYRQFCQHFLAPLALMSKIDARLGALSRCHIDGLPLDLSSSLLPWHSWLCPGLLAHLHLHARAQKKYSASPIDVKERRMSRRNFAALLQNLLSCVERLQWEPSRDGWNSYYENQGYSARAQASKAAVIREWAASLPCRPRMIWDLGANTGFYSRLLREFSVHIVSFDSDPSCVEADYLEARGKKENILPLLMDLTNPTPGLGWAGEERLSLLRRGPADLVLALAILHHLAISNNLPFARIADFLSRTGEMLIIEFVPKEDLQVQGLLRNRKDIFSSYSEECFRSEFLQYFSIDRVARIEDSDRTLYLMRKR